MLTCAQMCKYLPRLVWCASKIFICSTTNKTRHTSRKWPSNRVAKIRDIRWWRTYGEHVLIVQCRNELRLWP